MRLLERCSTVLNASISAVASSAVSGGSIILTLKNDSIIIIIVVDNGKVLKID